MRRNKASLRSGSRGLGDAPLSYWMVPNEFWATTKEERASAAYVGRSASGHGSPSALAVPWPVNMCGMWDGRWPLLRCRPEFVGEPREKPPVPPETLGWTLGRETRLRACHPNRVRLTICRAQLPRPSKGDRATDLVFGVRLSQRRAMLSASGCSVLGGRNRATPSPSNTENPQPTTSLLPRRHHSTRRTSNPASARNSGIPRTA